MTIPGSTKRLHCIMLIDDDESTNLLHELVLEEVDIAEHVKMMYNGKDALSYLNKACEATDNSEYPFPQLILLDLNMPVMNGFDFMKAFNEIDCARYPNPVVVVLTTSLLIDEYIQENPVPGIQGYKNKPLTQELIMEVLDTYFPL